MQNCFFIFASILRKILIIFFLFLCLDRWDVFWELFEMSCWLFITFEILSVDGNYHYYCWGSWGLEIYGGEIEIYLKLEKHDRTKLVKMMIMMRWIFVFIWRELILNLFLYIFVFMSIVTFNKDGINTRMIFHYSWQNSQNTILRWPSWSAILRFLIRHFEFLVQPFLVPCFVVLHF